MYCGSKKGSTIPNDALLFVTGVTIRVAAGIPSRIMNNPVRPDFDAEGLACHVLGHDDLPLHARHGPAAEEVEVALVGHLDVERPQAAFVHQLEDACADRLGDRVGSFPFQPSVGRGSEVVREDLDTSCRTVLGFTAANVLFAFEQAEYLDVAILLIPAGPLGEIFAVDAATELGVEAEVLGKGPILPTCFSSSSRFT